MPKSTRTNDSQAVLLIDAPEEEVVRLHKDLPGWRWLGASDDWPSNGGTNSADQSIDAIIVFAHKDKERHALDTCFRLCEKEDMENVPLFIAASRYQMNLVNEVKRLPRGDFLFTPIDTHTLLKKMKERAKEGVNA